MSEMTNITTEASDSPVSNKTVLRLDDVRKSFGNTQVLRGISFDIHQHVGEEVELLEHHADTCANLVLVGTRVGDIGIAQPNLAVIDLFKQVDAFHQCGFA